MGWNGSGRTSSAPVQPKGKYPPSEASFAKQSGYRGAKKPSPVRGLIAGAVVVTLAIVAYFAFFSGSEKPQAEKSDKGRGRIKEVTPAATPKVSKKEVKEKKTPYWLVDASQTNGFSKPMLMKWRFAHRAPAGWTNDTSRTAPRPKYAIFNHNSENEIALFLTLEPGSTLVGSGNYNDRFRKDFLESMKEPIIPSEEDTEEQKALKCQMNQTKIELAERLRNGEDICQIMTETRKEFQKMAQLKNDLMREIRERSRSGEATTQDIDDIIAAADKMLSDRGIAPLKVSPMMKYCLQRHCSDYQPNKNLLPTKKESK